MSARRLLFAVPLTLLVLAHAPAARAGEAGTLSGRVTGPAWSKVLTVTATPVGEGEARATTVANGATYSLDLAPGRYVLRFAGEDGVRPEYHANALTPEGSAAVTVTAHDVVEVSAHLETDPGTGVVTGSVRDAAGAPVRGLVELLRRDADTGTWQVRSSARTRTDGTYVVSGAPGGGYVLRFAGVGLGPVFHPAGATPVEGEQLTLTGGTTRRVDAVLCAGGPCRDAAAPIRPVLRGLGVGSWRAAAFAVTVSATGVAPTGTVAVRSGGTTLATVPLRGGSATFTVPGLRPGLQELTLVYSGAVGVEPASLVRTVRVW